VEDLVDDPQRRLELELTADDPSLSWREEEKALTHFSRQLPFQRKLAKEAKR